MILFFDTETTGLVQHNIPPDHPSQPRCVQLAAELYGKDGNRPLHNMSVIIKPDNYTIPEAASNIHGITTEIAITYGASVAWAMNGFLGLCAKADTICGHNINFDIKVILKELHLLGKWTSTSPDPLPAVKYCTMDAMTNVCKLPGKFNKYKWPRLEEAYLHVTGSPLEKAHDALIDLRATKTVYDWLQTNKH